MTRVLSLTPALVAQVQRDMPEMEPPAGYVPMADADFHAMSAQLLATRPAEGELCVFAYGSLIWRPGCAIARQVPATLHGWHRQFCFRITRFRGSDEYPGLMMTLDRGGSCNGVIQCLPMENMAACFEQVLRREHLYKPSSHRAVWVKVRSGGRHLTALAFVINRQAPTYLRGLSLDQQAEMIAFACGQRGTNAEYLLNTVEHLEALGIHDRYLWRLQELVAAKIAASAMPLAQQPMSAGG